MTKAAVNIEAPISIEAVDVSKGGVVPDVLSRVRRAAVPLGSDPALALADQVFVSGANFVTTVLIGRFAGASELGVFSLLFSILLLATAVQDALVVAPYTVFSNEMRSSAKRGYAGAAFMQAMILAAIAATLLCSAGILWMWMKNGAVEGAALLTAGLAVPFVLLREFLRRSAYAEMRLLSVVSLGLMGSGFQVLGLLVLVFCGIVTTANAYVVVAVACAGSSLLWLSHNHTMFRLRPSHLAAAIRRNWGYGRWVLMTQVGNVLSAYALPWVIAVLINAAAAGVYAACMSIVCLSNPVILGVYNILFPKAARAYARDGLSSLRRVIRLTGLSLTAVLSVFCGCVAIAGDWLIRCFYGEAYGGYRHAMVVMAVAVLLGAVGNVICSGLLVMKRPDVTFLARVAGILVTFAASLFVLRFAGVVGAAYCLAAGSAASALGAWGAYHRLIRQGAVMSVSE